MYRRLASSTVDSKYDALRCERHGQVALASEHHRVFSSAAAFGPSSPLTATATAIVHTMKLVHAVEPRGSERCHADCESEHRGPRSTRPTASAYGAFYHSTWPIHHRADAARAWLIYTSHLHAYAYVCVCVRIHTVLLSGPLFLRVCRSRLRYVGPHGHGPRQIVFLNVVYVETYIM